MEGMFNPLSILLHIMNAAILLTALYFLLLKPVRKFMDGRSESIRAELQSIENEKQALEEQKKAAQEEISAAKKLAGDTVAQSVMQAHDQAHLVLEEAHAEAEFLLKQARSEAEVMQKSSREEMRGEVAGLSITLAEKLLQREITEKDHELLIDEFLKKVV